MTTKRPKLELRAPFDMPIEQRNPGSALLPSCAPPAHGNAYAFPAMRCRGDIKEVNR